MATDPDVDLDALIGEAEVARDRFDAVSLVLISYGGPDLRVVVANAAARAFLGRQDIGGRPLVEVMPGFEGQQLIAMTRGVMASGEPIIAREWRVQTGSSETGDLREYYLDFGGVPYRNASGEVTEVIGYAIDVTERVLASGKASRSGSPTSVLVPTSSPSTWPPGTA